MAPWSTPDPEAPGRAPLLCAIEQIRAAVRHDARQEQRLLWLEQVSKALGEAERAACGLDSAEERAEVEAMVQSIGVALREAARAHCQLWIARETLSVRIEALIASGAEAGAAEQDHAASPASADLLSAAPDEAKQAQANLSPDQVRALLS